MYWVVTIDEDLVGRAVCKKQLHAWMFGGAIYFAVRDGDGFSSTSGLKGEN